MDGGSDSLMRGDEAGFGTPGEDMASIAAVHQVDVSRKFLVSLGFGVDWYHGVCHSQVLEAVAELTREGAFLGSISLLNTMPSVAKYIDACTVVRRAMSEEHASIVCSSILSALEGRFGAYHSTRLTGGNSLWINPLMTFYWCFELSAVAKRVFYMEDILKTDNYDDVDSGNRVVSRKYARPQVLAANSDMSELTASMNDRLVGILLGTAVGDALGLPAEGLSPARRWRLMPGPWRHRLVFGRGMVSDDTEHTLFVAQSLLKHPDNAEAFHRHLAWHLRWWFATLPAGIGKATARACIKLWLGFPPNRSGVVSAGNGPAMRSAVIGSYFHDEPELLRRFVLDSTQLTHTDPKATIGALAVARVAAWAVEHDPTSLPCPDAIAEMLAELAPDDTEWQAWIQLMPPTIAAGKSVPELASALGLSRGVTGYIYHTVPVAVYAWLRHYGDFRATLEAALDCGGDTDTVGAIAGAFAGATTGPAGIPESWLSGICDWPRSVQLLGSVGDRLGEQLHSGSPLGEVRYFWPAVLPRNLIFLLLVLLHGFRRLLPPY